MQQDRKLILDVSLCPRHTTADPAEKETSIDQKLDAPP
jgi:hypothetical protein